MKEKLKRIKDARRELLPLIQIAILGSFIFHVMMVRYVYPAKLQTLKVMVVGSFILFAFITVILLWSVTMGKEYKPTLSAPLDLIMLVLATTAVAFFVFLLTYEFAESVEFAEFLLKTTLFLLAFLGFLCYRTEGQKQYLGYAVAYAVSVLAMWMAESVDVVQRCADFLSNATGNLIPAEAIFVLITDIGVPIREAMLLFIILDVFLTAKEEPK